MTKRKQISICQEGWYYLAVLGFIAAGAMIRDINLLFILAGMMLGPLVLSWLLVHITLRSLTFTRHLPEVISVDDLLVVALRAESTARSGGSWAIVAEDRISRANGQSRDSTAGAKVLFSHVPSGSCVDGLYRARLGRRGRYRLGPLKLTTRAPLGLIRATLTYDLTDELLVCPSLGRLLPAWGKKLQLQHEGGNKTQRRQGKLEGDYYGLRDWRSGDSRRWIHWRTSAKRDQLAVKQFEQRKSQDLAVFLEAWQPAQPTFRDTELAERAISFTATLVADHSRRGNSHLLVACAGKEPMVSRGTSSPVFLQEIMERLATAEPDDHDHLPELLGQTLPRVSTNVRIVLVTTRTADLSDTDRFASVWHDPRTRRMLSGAIHVHVGDPEFPDWFQPDRPIGPSVATAPTTPAEAEP